MEPKKSRRETLEQFVTERPTDAFARYGLALECAKMGDNDSAVGHFRTLIENHPDYVVGYFQFGQLLGKLGHIEQARSVLSDGIAKAEKTGDKHARDEMEAALVFLR
jgi:tetratricopeptide (TPR) repeat protein